MCAGDGTVFTLSLINIFKLLRPHMCNKNQFESIKSTILILVCLAIISRQKNMPKKMKKLTKGYQTMKETVKYLLELATLQIYAPNEFPTFSPNKQMLA